MALAEFDKLPLAKFAQHSIYMDRSKAKGVSQVILGERAVEAVAVNCTYSLQTRFQLEQQMCCPRQRVASSYVGKVLSCNRPVAQEGSNDERKQIRRFHSSKRQCLGGCDQQRKFSSSYERPTRAAYTRLRQNDISSQGKIENLSLPVWKLVGDAPPTRLDEVNTIAVVTLAEDYRVSWVSLHGEAESLDQSGVIIVQSDV